MDVGIRGRSNVEVGRNGRILDYRDPSQIVRNAERSTQAFTNFLETVTDVGSKVYKGYLKEQGAKQAGELLATQDPVDLIRAGTDEQRNVVRSLNPFARDIINQAAARATSERYLEQYQANLSKNESILTDPNASDEQKAAARSEAKRRAIETSGFSSVNPMYMAQLAPQIAAVEGKLDGKTYTATLERQKEADRAKTTNGLRVRLNQLVEQGQGVSEFTPENAEMVKKWMQDLIIQQSGAWTPNQLAGIIYDSFSTEVMRRVSNGEEVDAKELTDFMSAVTDLDVQTPSGASFFDIALPSGKSLGLAIAELGDKTNGRVRQSEGRRALEGVRDLIDRAIAGEDIPDDEVRARSSDIPTAVLLQTLQSLTKAEQFGQKPSREQVLNLAELEFEMATPGADRKVLAEKARGMLNSGDITVKQFAGTLPNIRDRGDQVVRSIQDAAGFLSDEIEVAAADLVRVTGKEQSAKDLIIEAKQNVRARANEAAAEGKPWDQNQYVDELRTEIESVRDGAIKQMTGGLEGTGPSSAKKVVDEVAYFQRKLMESGGEITVDSFPPELIDQAKRDFATDSPTPRQLSELLLKRMSAVQEEGKPLFPDPKKIIRGFQKGGRKSPLNGGGGPTNKNGLPTNQPLVDNINRLNSLLRGSVGLPTSKEGDQSKGEDSAKAAENVVASALPELTGVIPAANGAEVGSVENMPAVPTLNKVWKKQEPLSPDTEPLPQVSAAVPTRGVPMAIKNDTHPYFVAIGIAEGTRRPSGAYTSAYYGHTDPGDGFANRGTVSGGRGMGSAGPRQVDRQWMSKLTRQATQSAPVLQRLGLKPGTQGWDRAMFNILDLTVQAPAAVPDFIRKLGGAIRQGLTIESIAKARADSFINPATGRLEASGFGNSYSRLLADQRSRAGAYDYKRRL